MHIHPAQNCVKTAISSQTCTSPGRKLFTSNPDSVDKHNKLQFIYICTRTSNARDNNSTSAPWTHICITCINAPSSVGRSHVERHTKLPTDFHEKQTTTSIHKSEFSGWKLYHWRDIGTQWRRWRTRYSFVRLLTTFIFIIPITYSTYHA